MPKTQWNTMLPHASQMESYSQNRLRGLRTYLAGSMDLNPDGGIPWRRKITPLLNNKGVIVLDPTNKPYAAFPENPHARDMISQWKNQGEYDKVKDYMRNVRVMDLRMVDISDFLVVNLDLTIHHCGTYEEISTANRQKKPILCWVIQGKSAAPNWLFGMIPHQHIFGSIDDVLSYLDYVDREAEFETYNRWCIPKFDMLYNETVLSVIHADRCQVKTSL